MHVSGMYFITRDTAASKMKTLICFATNLTWHMLWVRVGHQRKRWPQIILLLCAVGPCSFKSITIELRRSCIMSSLSFKGIKSLGRHLTVSARPVMSRDVKSKSNTTRSKCLVVENSKVYSRFKNISLVKMKNIPIILICHSFPDRDAWLLEFLYV